MTTTSISLNRYMLRHIALPQDHGSWVFLISPLLIGLFAGTHFSLASIFLILGAFAGFLIRQPMSILVKAYSGRRPRHDIPVARFWIVVYGLLGLAAITGLVWQGLSMVLILAIPAIPVFSWHLYLVSRRAERRQMGVKIVASGVLALAAPGAYWVGVGMPVTTGWWLFILAWLQSAASIVYAYLRLEQRGLKVSPPILKRLHMAWRPVLYATFNLGFVSMLSAIGTLPRYLFLPFGLQWAETLWGTYHPAVNARPTAIGIRQLIVSSLFTIIFILTWER